MSRTHFYLSSEPVNFGRDLPLEGLCGARVSHPRPEVMWELSARGLPEFNSLRDCEKCVKAVEFAERDETKRHYLYGIVDCEAALHRGEGEEG